MINYSVHSCALLCVKFVKSQNHACCNEIAKQQKVENFLFTYGRSKWSGKQENSADFFRLCNYETVRLNADGNRKINETFVALVDGARNGTDNDLVIVEQI